MNLRVLSLCSADLVDPLQDMGMSQPQSDSHMLGHMEVLLKGLQFEFQRHRGWIVLSTFQTDPQTASQLALHWCQAKVQGLLALFESFF